MPLSCEDNTFGPVINHGCRAAFDFTLLFEQAILSIAPSALFLLLAPCNYVFLLRSPRKVQPSFLGWWKSYCIVALGAIQVVLLVLWALPSAPATNVSVAAAALGLPVALAMGLLSHAQHVRSVRPSTLLNVYLLLSLLCDIVQTRTLWLLHRATAIAAVFTASVFLKLVVLMTEAAEKRRLLEGKHQDATVESTSGIWNKMLFWWVNPLLWKGSRSILQPRDLQTINEKLHGAALEKVHPGVLAGMAYQDRRFLPGSSVVVSGLLAPLVAQVAPIFAPVATFALYAIVAAVSSHQSLLSAQAFTSLSLISILSTPIVTLTQSVPIIAAGMGALSRIQEYLSTTPRQERRNLDMAVQDCKSSSQIGEKNHYLAKSGSGEKGHPCAVTVQNGKFGWDDAAPTLRDIHCEFPTSSLTIIVGPIGSGKTSLLRALLNELPSIDGQVTIHGPSLAFCDQNPFLVHATVQKNIIGESALDSEWYKTVLKACALDVDLALLPLGDLTMVGSNGMTLSRGQKQRIAIARSVYAKASIVLLDDTLSGLDRRTERQVFNQVFGKQGLLRQLGSTVVLVTHANYLLPHADQIIVLGSDGRIESQGSYQSLRSSDGYVQSLSIEEDTAGTSEDGIEKTDAIPSTQDDISREAEIDLKERQTGDRSVYVYYLQAAGKANSLFFLVYVAIVAFCYNFPNLWVQWWSDANEKNSNANLGLYLGVYVALAVAAIVFLILACWCLMVRMVSRSALRLHKTVLRTVMRAPLSFFAGTSSGAITNRFSQDMRLIDMSLPMATINTTLYAASCVVQIILISISSKYMAVTIPFALAVIYFVQKFYLKTSRQLRLLDLEVKSPLYSNFIETLNGLVTIRAFGWSAQLQELNTKLLDESQKPVYLLYCVQRWLTLVMDMLVACLAIVLIILTVFLKGSTSGGAIGVALVNIMTFNQGLTNMIKWYTSLETALGAISRVKKFESETMSEERTTPTLGVVDQKWPRSGAIEFQNVSASYGDESSLALRNISMSIQAGQKIGICGRTGSGKSSLILALFQMIELCSGSILVDGIDLSTLPREAVRSGFNSITQEPFFIPATVRMNLDFTESLPDKAIIEALQKVKLWDFVEERGGLDSKLVADSWSLGQQQLFCLARALLRDSHVLILDEVSSSSPPRSVDSETDKLMQAIIRTEFAGSTVFSIAHRLDTILDFDRIAFLDKGSLVEFDSPTKLLAKGPSSSAFARLYNGLPDQGFSKPCQGNFATGVSDMSSDRQS
ncbi:hypothetical protein MPDQ_006453 [Monascus purpureus]|uniref:Uncharacterized protein n=1 Tax=Monascus purpureus TaxID=5098 RepID=A0A507QY12_MONPU|nr:hypothetical protein MPDQ_006453 [Monascus purpureus]